MRPIFTEVAVELLSGEVVVEAVDDIIVGGVGDGRACVKELFEV